MDEVAIDRIFAEAMARESLDHLADRQGLVLGYRAGMVRVPYDRTNQPHKAEIRLTTEDGDKFPTESPDALFTFDFEIGRPPGMKIGQEQNLPFAAKIGGIAFPLGGYRFEFSIDGELLDTAPFQAVRAQGIPR